MRVQRYIFFFNLHYFCIFAVVMLYANTSFTGREMIDTYNYPPTGMIVLSYRFIK